LSFCEEAIGKPPTNFDAIRFTFALTSSPDGRVNERRWLRVAVRDSEALSLRLAAALCGKPPRNAHTFLPFTSLPALGQRK
jgi:hypothetical protein